MTINRHTDQAAHSTLTVFFTNSASTPPTKPLVSLDTDAGPSNHDHWDSTETIDMKHKHSSEILQRLMEVTKAVQYEASEKDMNAIKEATEDKQRRAKARERQMRFNEKRRQEAAMLEQARNSTS